MPSLRILVVALLALGSAGVPSAAQTPRAPEEASASPASKISSPPGRAEPFAPQPLAAGSSETAPSRIKFLEGPDGRAVPVPAGATYEEFLRWLAARNEQPADRGPEYGVAWIALQGRAEEERALIDATIRVQVLAEDKWLRIPLRLNEGILRGTEHSGPGEAQFEGADREAGYRCWLRGRGEHVLKLSLVVPLRKSTPGRRLQLSLPAAAGGTLELTVPVPTSRLSVTAPAAERIDLQTVSAKDNASMVKASGITDRLDLTWQTLPAQRQVRPVLQVQTTAVVELTGESALLDPVVQRVQALQGSFSEIGVRIPQGFEVLQLLVDGRESTDQLLPGIEAEEILIKLAEPTAGPVELRWMLKATEYRKGELRFEGFNVRDALLQTGEIIIEPAEGLTVAQRGGRDVHRTNVLRPAGALSERATAYRFLTQPFELVLDVQEVEPYFTVAPRLFLRIGQKQADLFAELDVEVYRGAVRELELRWPNLQQESWTVDSLGERGLVDSLDLSEPGRLRVDLLQRQTARFRLLLRASRPITVGAEPFTLTLPVPEASNHSPSLLLAAREDSIDLELEPAEGTVLRQDALALEQDVARFLDNPGLPDSLRDLVQKVYVIDSEPHVLHVAASVHPQQVLTDSITTVRSDGESLQSEQRIDFHVDYRRLPQARFLVPAELHGRVRFLLLGSGDQQPVPLSAAWTETESAMFHQARVSFPQPQFQSFSILARFSVGLPDSFGPGAESDVQVPLIHCSEAPFGSTRFVFEPDSALEAAVAGAGWKRQLTLDNVAEWITTEHLSAVPLQLRHLELHRTPEIAIRQALIRSEFRTDGFAVSLAQYRIDGSPDVLTITLPPEELVREEFWWNDQPLGPDLWTEVTPGSGEYRLTPPASPTMQESHLLTVRYRSKSAYPFHWSRSHRLAAPQFSPGTWIDQTVWEVVLPVGQHLFVGPDGFTPEFHWARSTFFWERRPDPELADPSAWIGAAAGPQFSASSRGNRYQFSRFGPTGALEFRSMAQSLIVLCGAGLALAAGFVLLKIPATRSAVTLLGAATVLAGVGLWYSGPVQVLLQPAILGLVLAVAATWIDGALKRRRPVALLTFSSPSDFATPPASSHHRAMLGDIGPEDPTALRPARATLGREPASSTISGHQT